MWIEKCGWRNADGTRAQRGHVFFFFEVVSFVMGMTKCEWKNANDYMRMIKSLRGGINL